MSRKPQIDTARIRNAPNRVGAIIKKLRMEAGLSARELGDKVGVSTVNQFNREAGRRDIKLTDLLRYARALNVSAASLVLA